MFSEHYFNNFNKLFSNKREVWSVKLTVAKVRKVAHTLHILEEKDPKRLFEGNALLQGSDTFCLITFIKENLRVYRSF